jgi:hypothetical protein
MWLITWEDFIESSHRKSFRSYFLHSLVTSSLLGPNILLRTLFSNSLSVCTLICLHFPQISVSKIVSPEPLDYTQTANLNDFYSLFPEMKHTHKIPIMYPFFTPYERNALQQDPHFNSHSWFFTILQPCCIHNTSTIISNSCFECSEYLIKEFHLLPSEDNKQ